MNLDCVLGERLNLKVKHGNNIGYNQNSMLLYFKASIVWSVYFISLLIIFGVRKNKYLVSFLKNYIKKKYD